MLRGLLRWGREGSGKGAWVLCRVGLSLPGNGSGSPLEVLPYRITHSPYPIRIFSIRLSSMKNLTVTICLTIAVILGSVRVVC